MEDIERLKEMISQLGDTAEQSVNDAIHGEGAKIATTDITKFIPVGARKNKHARFSEPFKTLELNLGIEITTMGGKKGFGYLIFPDEGKGKRNRVAQDFTGKGLKIAKPKVIEEIQKQVIEKIKGAM